MSQDGYRPDPEDTKALEKFRAPPKNVGEVRTLVGFLGYYRNYVKDFSKKMKPVYDLLKADNDGGKQNLRLKVKLKSEASYDKKRVTS